MECCGCYRLNSSKIFEVSESKRRGALESLKNEEQDFRNYIQNFYSLFPNNRVPSRISVEPDSTAIL